MIVFFKDGKKRTILFLCLSLVSLIVSFFDIGKLPVDAAWLAILLCGTPIVKGAAIGLVTKFDIKAGVLVSLALFASIIIGEVFAAGEIAFIMAIGAFLEERTVAKARAGIERLVRLSPATARVLRDGEEHIVAAEHVRVGEILRVLAGETIAADGVIIHGQTSVDQSIMTGEPLPIDKNEGDEVQSGTINQFGTFDMVVQKAGDDSSLQRMIRLVASADSEKTKIVGLVDRWATWIVVIALVSAGLTWFFSGEIIRAVTILVVFCPCALVLATPTAIMAGIGNATKYGILVGQGDALERLSKVTRVAFDKTGTLTYGRPSVTQVDSYASNVKACELLEIAASAELRSEHPLGKAIVAHYKQQYGKTPPEPESFQLLPGRGVVATVKGEDIQIGNESQFTDCRLKIPAPLTERINTAKANGNTVVYVTNKERLLGIITLSDTIRPDAVQTIKEIQATGTKITLLTGDALQTAQHVADITGITDIKAACLPEDKLIAIRQYQNSGEPICMVGDGINDAPALKIAQVGIAMGGIGSDIAIETADITLVGDDIKVIPHLIMLSRKVMTTINVSITASLLLNFAAIALATTGLLSPVLGALVHNLGSLAVILNSVLLLNWRRRKT